MAGKDEPPEEGGLDWRRLAADRNVSTGIARALWHQAHANAHDPAQAERAYHGMLDDAAAANATHEPGRATLAGSMPRDAGGLGAGKWTRVLLENQTPAKRAAPKPAGEAKDSAEDLRDKLAAVTDAGKHAAAQIAASDPATIVEALRELRDTAGPGVLQTIMNAAGSVIERMLIKKAETQAAAGRADPLAPATPGSGPSISVTTTAAPNAAPTAKPASSGNRTAATPEPAKPATPGKPYRS